MGVNDEPLITVLTPVYNGEPFLRDCIESVIAQTYKNFEYIIVNNCSSDRSLDIALSYSKQDPRIQVRSNKEFVDIIENHNTAFRLVSPSAKYCKVVSADDGLFPDCITRLVETAEAYPSAGFVGCYQISGNRIRWQGFPYPKALLNGRELCRQMLLNNDSSYGLADDRSFGFGAPTSLLYRADLVRRTATFFPNASPHADTSACYANLKDCDFAFVYQVLCWERLHAATQSTQSFEINDLSYADLNDIMQYARFYLSSQEYEQKLQQSLNDYYEFMAINIIARRGRTFWDYHKGKFEELGYPMKTSAVLKAVMVRGFREIVNPAQAIRKIRRRFAGSMRR